MSVSLKKCFFAARILLFCSPFALTQQLQMGTSCRQFSLPFKLARPKVHRKCHCTSFLISFPILCALDTFNACQGTKMPAAVAHAQMESKEGRKIDCKSCILGSFLLSLYLRLRQVTACVKTPGLSTHVIDIHIFQRFLQEE